MINIVLIALAGALGAVSRWGLSRGLAQWLGSQFPYGTLLANVLGCFLLGLVMHIGLNTDKIPPSIRLAITVGFLGALTTFSTFSYETIALLQDGNWAKAGWNILANLSLGLIATLAGFALGRTFIGGAS